MQKLKTFIPQNKWGTIKSKYKPESKYVTMDEFTAGSYNFVTNVDGAIEKRPTSVQYNPATLTNVGKDQFEAIFANGVHHLLIMDGAALKYTTGDGIFTQAATGYTPTANMEYQMFQNRVYFDNGVDNPSVYDLTASYGGVTYTPPQVKAMGAQPPGSAVTFAADSGTGLTGSFHYKVTFLYYGAEESNGSAASALHTVTNKTINLTAVPIGGYGVTARKIYRDANDGNYLLVGTISDNTTTTFADATTAGTTPIPTANNTPPVWRYIALNLSRLWVAGVSGTPNTIYWSNPGLPDIFDPDNFIECNPGDPIQAIYVYQGVVVVLNRHSIGQITGTTDDSFAYQQIPGSVGCTDNRSLQIRTISGVPILVWLSDRGVYGFNGSSVEYLSDPIEDEVNLNIQQSNFVNGSVAQSTQADWAAGTSTPGIDLASNPGQITTIDPTRLFESQADWESGTLTNIGTKLNGNMIKVPTAFAPTLASGTLSGTAIINGSNVETTLVTGFTGETSTFVGSGPFLTFSGQAIRIVPADSGYVTSVDIINPGFHPVSHIYSDVSGAIGSDLGLIASVHLTGGNAYWIVQLGDLQTNTTFRGTALSGNASRYFASGTWHDPGAGVNWIGSYTFNHDAHAASGTWQSPIYDSKAIAVGSGMSLVITGSYPGVTTGSVVVEGSDDQLNWLTSQTVVQPTGTTSLSTSGRRYWRLTYQISTTDNRQTADMSAAILKFNITGTWVSPAIQTTVDGTSFISLPVVENLPSGTAVLVQVRTSVDGSSWSSYSDISLAVINRYAQIRITLTATSDDASTPSVVSAQLNWNLSSTFTSSIIDIGIVPTGWGIFQDVAAENGGTEVFSMRSASSSGGIPAATFRTVTNGSFPNVLTLPLQFTQFRVVLTATPGSLPTIDSVTINYVTGINQSPIRVASLFFNKTYYLAAAELNQTVNNVVLSYDFEGNWRIFRNVNINSLSLFFNAPYYLDAVRKFLYQWLTPSTGTSESITMDFRTKAFDLDDTNRLKSVRSMCVIGLNTGTTIHAYYSVDRGTTWIEMLNSSGVVGYVTTMDGNKFDEYFVPDYSIGSIISGTTIMFRVVSSDAFPCTILSLDMVLYFREGRYLGRPV